MYFNRAQLRFFAYTSLVLLLLQLRLRLRGSDLLLEHLLQVRHHGLFLGQLLLDVEHRHRLLLLRRVHLNNR